MPGPVRRLQRVSGQGGRPAGIGHDGDAVALRRRLVRQRQCAVEQGLDALTLDGAGLLAGTPRNAAWVTGQGAGVRGGGGLAADAVRPVLSAAPAFWRLLRAARPRTPARP